jgi:hypothetical protein
VTTWEQEGAMSVDFTTVYTQLARLCDKYGIAELERQVRDLLQRAYPDLFKRLEQEEARITAGPPGEGNAELPTASDL